MRMLAAAVPGAGVDARRPAGGMARVVGKASDGNAQVLVAGPSEHNAAALAGGVRDRSDAGLGGELLLGLEAFADVAEFGEDLCGADAAGV
jgi:hypothetical protein